MPRGVDIVILAKLNYGQTALVAKASGPIRTLGDLKGQRWAGVNRGSGMDVLLQGYVLKDVAKLDPETDLQLLQVPAGNMNAHSTPVWSMQFSNGNPSSASRSYTAQVALSSMSMRPCQVIPGM